MINAYEFGKIEVDGQCYDSDILIFPDGSVRSSWWRTEGHILAYEDIDELVDRQPDIIVVGKGKPGRMEPETGLAERLSKEGISLEVYPTTEAIKRYNEICNASKVGACFHLTC